MQKCGKRNLGKIENLKKLNLITIQTFNHNR